MTIGSVDTHWDAIRILLSDALCLCFALLCRYKQEVSAMNNEKTADVDGPKGCSSLNLDLIVDQIR